MSPSAIDVRAKIGLISELGKDFLQCSKIEQAQKKQKE
jgi:hypothetical protein